MTIIPLHTLVQGTAQKKVSIDSYLPDIKTMSDEELIEELRDYGATPGPITNTTRLVYQKKLASFKAKVFSFIFLEEKCKDN